MKSYDVALSFAGEDRQFARELAELLSSKGVSVFFDEFEEHKLWGEDLYSYLCDIYKNRSQYVVVFTSKFYAKKAWTNVERKAAQAAAFTKSDPYILPVRLDDAEVEGILPTVGYIDWSAKGSQHIANLLLKKLGVILNGRDGASLIRIPQGEFTMGSDSGPTDRASQHAVWLDTFYIYRDPVTYGQFRAFCEDTGNSPNVSRMEFTPNDRHPIVCVSWHDAMAYCEWADVTLPTEAQWEKAARGTDGRRFAWGNTWEEGRCEYRRLAYGHAGIPAEVGSFPRGASSYGVQDMCGNIWEWCSDWYDPQYYSQSPDKNPQGPRDGERKVRRGCSWQDDSRWFPLNFECSFRDSEVPHFEYRLTGFRCVKNT